MGGRLEGLSLQAMSGDVVPTDRRWTVSQRQGVSMKVTTNVKSGLSVSISASASVSSAVSLSGPGSVSDSASQSVTVTYP
jgi:hypothetical protein